MIGWYGLYGVLFDQLRRSSARVNHVTEKYRESTTLLQALQFSDTFENNARTADENFFDFENEANLEIWLLMREHV